MSQPKLVWVKDYEGPDPGLHPEHPIVIPPGKPPDSGAHPEHPIVIPPDGLAPGVPTHPIYLPVYPAHPIVLPPGSIGPGIPTHPIVLPDPPTPSHPIVIPPDFISDGVPTHPIVLPPEQPPIELPSPPFTPQPPAEMPPQGFSWAYAYVPIIAMWLYVAVDNQAMPKPMPVRPHGGTNPGGMPPKK